VAAGIYALVFDPEATNIEEIERYRKSDTSYLNDDTWDHIYVNSDEMKIGELSYEYPPYDWLAMDFKLGKTIDDSALDKVKRAFLHFHCTPPRELMTFLKGYMGKILVIWVL
jgi:hypothetical protein